MEARGRMERLRISLVPPMIVPPEKKRGMMKVQVPSEFWRVMVRVKGTVVNAVWPASRRECLSSEFSFFLK